MKTIRIKFDKKGEGWLECVGYKTFRCLGKEGLKYKKDVTVKPAISGTKQNPHYSETYGCPPHDQAPGHMGRCIMPYAILIDGMEGIYIHEWYNPATYDGNGGPTHGCVHLDTGNAKIVYDWVDQPTRVLISYPW